jgi:hypothetical protein
MGDIAGISYHFHISRRCGLLLYVYAAVQPASAATIFKALQNA